jgi:hypothetical protein
MSITVFEIKHEVLVGNIVEYDGKLVRVEKIDPHHHYKGVIGIQNPDVEFPDIVTKWMEKFKPVPLTEEMLHKLCDLNQLGHIWFIGERMKDKSFEVSWNDVGKWYAYYRNFNSGEGDDFVLLRNDLAYLHQLQNILLFNAGIILNVDKLFENEEN